MRYIIAILIILLIVTNLFWIYNAIDKGVTANHSASEQSEVEKSAQTLLLLNNLFSLGQDYENVLDKLESPEFKS